MKLWRNAGFAILAALVTQSAWADWLIVLNKSDHEAALVDPKTLAVVAKVPVGKGPHEVAVSFDGRIAYVTNYGAYGIFRPGESREDQKPGSTISVIDLKKRTVIATWDLGEYRSPHGIIASRDGTRVWVTCEGNQAVLELDAATGKILKS